MDKYKHRVSFRLEKRKDKEGNYAAELPINADITFGGKRVWYYSGYKIAPSKWDEKSQRVKRNNFNSEGVSASDINQRLLKIATAVPMRRSRSLNYMTKKLHRLPSERS